MWLMIVMVYRLVSMFLKPVVDVAAVAISDSRVPHVTPRSGRLYLWGISTSPTAGQLRPLRPPFAAVEVASLPQTSSLPQRTSAAREVASR